LEAAEKGGLSEFRKACLGGIGDRQLIWINDPMPFSCAYDNSLFHRRF